YTFLRESPGVARLGNSPVLPRVPFPPWPLFTAGRSTPMRRLGCVIVLVSLSQVARGQDSAKSPELMPLPELGIPDLRSAPPNELRSAPAVEPGSLTPSPVPGATGSTGVAGAVHVPAALAAFPSLPAASPPPTSPPQLSALPVGP